ncbi:MAG: thiol-disulfide oxidoreductase [Flavobacteriales bacterium]|nr:MAG: thiol-disulfide oxidoreductase [Flavobacteriales bacterium]
MNKQKHIILFDGECNFCSFWVKYVVKKDKRDVFRFASLQSEIGREYLLKYKIDAVIDSVVLIENDKTYIKSTAAFRVLKTLGGFISIFYGFIIVPEFIRNFFYDIMASVRYKLFGQKTCELPLDANYKNKFL